MYKLMTVLLVSVAVQAHVDIDPEVLQQIFGTSACGPGPGTGGITASAARPYVSTNTEDQSPLISEAKTVSVHDQNDVDKRFLKELLGTLPNNFLQPTTVPTVRSHVDTNAESHHQATTTRFSTPDYSDTGHFVKKPEVQPCLMPDGNVGFCVQFYLCSKNNTIITNGSKIIDIRMMGGACSAYMDVCCLRPNIHSPDNPITPAPTNEEHQGCGWRNPTGVGFRITGDKDGEAEFAEFPWMVAIVRMEPVENDEDEDIRVNLYMGGGSLIHPSVVLTAAHHVERYWKKRLIRCRAGEWDTQTKKEIYPYQDRNVIEVKIHENFDNETLYFDIALLFLKTPMDLAPNVGLACLPPPRELVTDGTRCFASGWGKDHFGKEGHYQVILKKLEVPVVEHSKCQEELRFTRLGPFFQLHSSFMCAGGEGDKDTCKGDGGSPLVCPIELKPERYMQSGIVAWGIGCGTEGTPGVYVDVSYLREWVDDAVGGKGYDTSVYSF